ncbi:MAG TPA: phospho-sugar mutase [Acidimicrobiales bacterium]|nr:MAG: hypothetical protein B7Z69_09725 [Actinobacteria bacterium 21-73-9]HQU27031.1 phospho-sugar mutase [Acidimicrobiales bacterium]
MSDWTARVRAWCALDPDEHDRDTLEALLAAGDETALARHFEPPLTFGTAGLRGPEEPGPAGMNRATVRRATQGVAAWLAERGVADPLVVVGRDARRGSERFNDEVVATLLGAGVRVLELPRPLPTPFVPYCVKAVGASAGVVVTASHNPPRDNGYKLYAADGAQILAPDDELVERHMAAAGPARPGSRGAPGHAVADDHLLGRYRDHLLERFAVGDSDLAITYTPLHGVGGATATDLLARAGYRRLDVVAAQFEPDPAFPTLPFPNPEEPGALDLAIASAQAAGSSLVLANDPDADRLGAAVRTPEGWRVLRGDEIGALLASTLLEGARLEGRTVATSLVSSSLLAAMAAAAGVACATTLTGFKWIARAGGPGGLAFGYEEALGFAVDPFVADKDGLSAALCLARLAHELAAAGTTLLGRLDELETAFGVHATSALSVRASGADAPARIAAAVGALAAEPPTRLGELAVTGVEDLARGWRSLPATEGVRLALGGLGRVVVRPSGTEPKVKAYLELTPPREGSLAAQRARAASWAEGVLSDLSARLQLGS